MVDLAAGGALEAAAWKVRNLEDYNARLERAARRVDELARAHETAALVIYEAALMKSGRLVDSTRSLAALVIRGPVAMISKVLPRYREV